MGSRQSLNFSFSCDLCSKTDFFPTTSNFERPAISKLVELEKTYVPLLKGLSSGKTDLKQKMGISFTEKEPRSIIERSYGGYKVLYLILKNDRFQRVQKCPKVT